MDENNTQTQELPPDLDTQVRNEADAMFERWNAVSDKPAEEAKPVEQVEENKPEPKAEEKPAEKPAEEDDFPTKGPKTEAAKNAWTALKQELRELKESKLPATEKLAHEREIALEEAKKRLAEFEGKDISQYERRIQELESKYAEAEKFRAIHDVANSETYRNEILLPAEKIGQDVDILAKMYEADAKQLKDALQIQDPTEQRRKIKELTEGWDAIDVTDLMSAARSTRQLVSRSQELLDNAEKTKSELRFIEEHEGKKKAETEAATFKAANEAVEKSMWEKIPRFKDDVEVKDAVSKAEVKNDPTSRVLGAKAAAILPYVLRQLDRSDARIKELEDNLAKRVSASPKVTSSPTPEKSKGSEPIDFSPEVMMERFKASFGS